MGGAKTLVIDVDGVLTDGKLYIDANGEKMFKAFNSKDIRAIREFVSHGYRVVMVTADDWPGSQMFAQNCGCEIIVLRDKSKLNIDEYVLVCDSVWDVPLIKKALAAYCPQDIGWQQRAHLSQVSGKILEPLKTNAGGGVIDELVYIMLHQYATEDVPA